MRALIASGTGRYSDPWHPFEETTDELARLVGSMGASVGIERDVDRAMESLGGIDLLVVNAGDPWRNRDGSHRPSAASITGFARALDSGIGVLAMHCAVSSLRDYPEWPAAIGGMWVPGLSFHPAADLASIRGLAPVDGMAVTDFTVFDERYCRLQRIGRSTVLAEHDGPDGVEPTAWVRTVGRSRVAVDVLGHDARSYESAGHRQLIAALVQWVTRVN